MVLSDGTDTFRVTTHFGRADERPRVTAVRVELTPALAYTGIARCSARDQFVKETGRRIALGRALRAAGMSREARTALWRSYFIVRAGATVNDQIAAYSAHRCNETGAVMPNLLPPHDFVVGDDSGEAGAEHGGEA